MSEYEENEAIENTDEANMEDGPDLIREAFDAAQEAGQSEDDVKLSLIQAGATFKNVTRLYNQYMIDSGLAMSKEDKAEALDSTLDGATLDTEEGFTEAVAQVVLEVTGATDKSAAAMVRAWAKKNEVEFYKRPKGTGASKSGFASEFYAFLKGNPTMSEDEAKAYILGEGDHKETSDNVKNHLSHYMGIYKLCNEIANS